MIGILIKDLHYTCDIWKLLEYLWQNYVWKFIARANTSATDGRTQFLMLPVPFTASLLR